MANLRIPVAILAMSAAAFVAALAGAEAWAAKGAAE